MRGGAYEVDADTADTGVEEYHGFRDVLGNSWVFVWQLHPIQRSWIYLCPPPPLIISKNNPMPCHAMPIQQSRNPRILAYPVPQCLFPQRTKTPPAKDSQHSMQLPTRTAPEDLRTCAVAHPTTQHRTAARQHRTNTPTSDRPGVRPDAAAVAAPPNIPSLGPEVPNPRQAAPPPRTCAAHCDACTS